MGQIFHSVHVRAPKQKDRDEVVNAVLAYAQKTGYVPAKSAKGAARVIRLGGKAPWFSIEDTDPDDVAGLAAAVAKATKLDVLEGSCDGHWSRLRMFEAGKKVGELSGTTKPGAAKHVGSLLDSGTPKQLVETWNEGFGDEPETAFTNAAKLFGIAAKQMCGAAKLTGETIALERNTSLPKLETGEPAFYVSVGVALELVDGRVEPHRIVIHSQRGPGRGLSIAFKGSAIAKGHIEIEELANADVQGAHVKLQLVRDGNTWRDPNAEIPAAFKNGINDYKKRGLKREEAEALQEKRQWYLDVVIRPRKRGRGKLEIDILTADGKATGWCQADVDVAAAP